ncbi:MULTISPECIES: hypothetical protein [unclassified Sphingobacterium]|uniref:hypothetical protein n=1 Tax=unclassified Sphingobacterium TaxID=2609468 RepID=UPI001044DAA8|nr:MULTISPECIES: hypothetical protein [unclassified Sphingobacterium]MCS3554288.1 GR25 family glycosyltransferase involved in LPS biosynthesis [Sphingobacterium sp. JUb21]TCR08121.1 hypothetical protein EDF66_104226 [Sphingobacterium sp. JUb20]
MKIPTYIINLKHRTDRYKNIVQEFEDRNEFNLTVFTAVENKIGSIGLWQSLLQIINIAKSNKLGYVLICEDDHLFTNEYNVEKLNEQIKYVSKIRGEILLGGVSWFDYSVKVNDRLYWINEFTGTQFLIVFANFYDKILDYKFYEGIETIDSMISKLSDKIFVSFPIVSIQRDTGYSDVTQKNDSKGVVQALFNKVKLRMKAIDKMEKHILSTKYSYYGSNYNDIQIPAYVINIDERYDRLEHIKSQFANKNEFELEFLIVQKEEKRTMGLWNNIKKIISMAIERDEDIIIICEDDHVFSGNYNKEILFDSIFQGAELGADIILGGISNTTQAIVVSPELCWIESFQCTQFTILFKNIFEQILSEPFDETDAADLILSMMSANKYVIHPFISRQKDFGYSDIPIEGFRTDQYDGMFENCEAKISRVRDVKKLLN